MNIIKKRYWTSDNNVWKVYGVVRNFDGIHTAEVRIMKLKNNRHEFYYSKQIPNYVLKERDLMYAELTQKI